VPHPFRLPPELQQKYVTHLGELLVEVDACANNEQLERIAHRLAGSAGAYGYTDLGQLCRSINDGLRHRGMAFETARDDLAQALRKVVQPSN
jgi:HPt (histidine-containing phosphotransfer) domain-containing protein